VGGGRREEGEGRERETEERFLCGPRTAGRHKSFYQHVSLPRLMCPPLCCLDEMADSPTVSPHVCALPRRLTHLRMPLLHTLFLAERLNDPQVNLTALLVCPPTMPPHRLRAT